MLLYDLVQRYVCFCGEFTISPKYGHHIHFYRNINLYHRPVSSRVERSTSYIRNVFKRTMLEHCRNYTRHPPTYATTPNKCRHLLPYS